MTALDRSPADAATLVRRVIATVVLTTMVLVAMTLLDTGPDPVLVVTAGLGAGAVIASLIDLVRLGRPVERTTVATPGDDAGFDAKVRSLRFNLLSMRDERADRLYRLLVELIDDQLHSVHGVDRRRDPVAAETLLGPDLHAFVTDERSAASLKQHRRLERVVTRIEEL